MSEPEPRAVSRPGRPRLDASHFVPRELLLVPPDCPEHPEQPQPAECRACFELLEWEELTTLFELQQSLGTFERRYGLPSHQLRSLVTDGGLPETDIIRSWLLDWATYQVLLDSRRRRGRCAALTTETTVDRREEEDGTLSLRPGAGGEPASPAGSQGAARDEWGLPAADPLW